MRFFFYNSFLGYPQFIKVGIAGFFLAFGWLFALPSEAEDYHVLKSRNAEVLFPQKYEVAAHETSQMLPEIVGDLQTVFGWSFTFKPTIILMEDSEHFRRMAGSPLVIGFAIPGKNLVVIDYSKIERPFEFQDILKHELCHLLIHYHVNEIRVPRWMDEGVAQWVSKGAMDIVQDQKGRLLPKAVFSDRIIPLGALDKDFPQDPQGLRLAYEESKSFLDYLLGTYGKEKLLQIFIAMKNGSSLRKAFLETLEVPFYKVEEKWQASLRKNVAWLAYLSHYLYEILFALGGLMIVYGFFRILKKKRAYMDEPE